MTISLEEFQNWLEQHGARLQAWPEDRLQAGEALLEQDPKAVAHLEQAQALGSWLDESPSVVGSAQLRRRGAEIPIQQARDVAGLSGSWSSWLRASLAAVFIGMAGLMTGAWTAPSVPAADNTELDVELYWDEFSELALAGEFDTGGER